MRYSLSRQIRGHGMQLDTAFAIDCAVVALYFFTIIFVGLKFGKKEESLEDLFSST